MLCLNCVCYLYWAYCLCCGADNTTAILSSSGVNFLRKHDLTFKLLATHKPTYAFKYGTASL